MKPRAAYRYDARRTPMRPPRPGKGKTLMRGIGGIEFGGREALQLVDLPDVHAGPGEVRIRVRAATVKPTDLGLRNGSRAEALREVPPPHVPGMDVAGVVDEVGPDTATDLAVG